MPINKIIGELDAISTEDINRFGTDVLCKTENEPGTAVLCKLGQKIVDAEGKITTCKSEKLSAAFVDSNGDLKMVAPVSLDMFPGKSVVSADDVKMCKQREQKLSEEDRKLLNAYVYRHCLYENPKKPPQDLIDNWTDNCIKREKLLQNAIREQRDYESLSTKDKNEFDARMRGMYQRSQYEMP